MNCTFNATVHTCSTESLIKKYQKAVKLGSFRQGSAHIFLERHDDGF